MNYEKQAKREALRWSKSLDKRSSILQRSSKRMQSTINGKIPDRVHNIVTDSIRSMIELALTSSEYIRPVTVNPDWSFEEREEQVRELLKQYKRTASVEGAGTGLGGVWLGVADFPLLLSIKMKFLFDAAQVYGFDIHSYQERVFLLHVFMLAFSGDNARREVKKKVMEWNELEVEEKNVDWKTLQIEYRDTLDLVKLFQLVPGFGAVVGYVANGRLLEQLGETTIQSSRLRLL
ncbi:EcsC family protein [Halobacillus karajensis]|uniref:EcsC protein family protein n=1 Tax=Halobacillus karajensis TaxID=195088 RepID=A0A059NY33_9BACI|nr:EcsC family protein [Halobacillus karajensis]CDQ21102.1 EcsC protein family protein [Halobacillus karajensis]CDQ24834.1 EcsC protein family protein [Halobacillus karajensis]CDQ28806.1 EcsC protein family protein [Halobacillus karajensis]